MPGRLGERATFRALRHRNARLFFSGLWVSQVGSWMQTVATALLVKRLAPPRWEGLLLGVSVAAQFVPMLLFGVWFGAFADRRNRWRLTVITQSAMAVHAFVLAALAFADLANIPVLLGMSLVLGIIGTVDNPARRGVVTELVEPSGLVNAMALNTATMTGSRAIGPALAALVIPTLGFGWAFLMNAVSYVAILVGLLAMRRDELHPAPAAPRGGTPVRDALRYVRNDAPLARIFVVMVLVSTFAFNYQVALPLVIEDDWGAGEAWYGILLAVVSAGSFVGALYVAGRPQVSERFYYGLTLLLAASSAAMAFAPNVWWAVVLSIPLGVGGAGFLSVGNALSQMRSPGDMRSRMLALVAVAFLGSTPIGGPITGLVGDLAGSRWALGYGGVVAFAAASWGAWSLARARNDSPVGLAAQ
jgi:MFS family permease